MIEWIIIIFLTYGIFKECELKYTLTVSEYGANSFSQAFVIAWLMSLRWKITSEISFGCILVILVKIRVTCKRRHVNAHDLKPLVFQVTSGDELHDGPSAKCLVAKWRPPWSAREFQVGSSQDPWYCFGNSYHLADFSSRKT